MKRLGVLARRAWLVPIFLPAVVIFPLLDRFMGTWWGFAGVGLYVVTLFLWVQLPWWTGRTTRATDPRHRPHP